MTSNNREDALFDKDLETGGPAQPLPLAAIEDISDSEASMDSPTEMDQDVSGAAARDSEVNNHTARTPRRPMRVFFPLGRGPDGRELYTVRVLEAVGGRNALPWNSANSSSETLAPSVSSEETLWQLRDDGFGSPSIPDRHPLRRSLSSPRGLPTKKGNRVYRFLRWNFGSVYRRIFTLAFLGNVTAIIAMLIKFAVDGKSLTYQAAGTAVSANVLASLLVRNEHVVNVMFVVFGSWPSRMPLRLKRLCAKVYSYGGIHSGCGVAAVAWYFVFLGLVTKAAVVRGNPTIVSHLVLTSWVILADLVLILAFAHPALRRRMHNSFEWTHRFLGWCSILLFWVQTLLICADDATSGAALYSHAVPVGMAVVMSPSFWILVAITLLVAYPWTRLRLRDVEAEPMSDHVIKLNFKYADVQYGQAVRLTDRPLWETHAFAVIPNPTTEYAAQLEEMARKTARNKAGSRRPGTGSSSDTAAELDEKAAGGSSDGNKAIERTPLESMSNAGQPGFSVLVSNAGDWTSQLIKNPPKRIWTRGAPQFGVLRVAGLFRPCIVVATGSGIGPCLSLFVQKPDHPVRIVWSAKRPEQTYGKAVMDVIRRADPSAVVIDTAEKDPLTGKPKNARPDLVDVIWRVWEGSRWEAANRSLHGRQSSPTRADKSVGPCEAVVIISNQKVTEKVVYGLESRGVPAYGAIFDS